MYKVVLYSPAIRICGDRIRWPGYVALLRCSVVGGDVSVKFRSPTSKEVRVFLGKLMNLHFLRKVSERRHHMATLCTILNVLSSSLIC